MSLLIIISLLLPSNKDRSIVGRTW